MATVYVSEAFSESNVPVAERKVRTVNRGRLVLGMVIVVITLGLLYAGHLFVY